MIHIDTALIVFEVVVSAFVVAGFYLMAAKMPRFRDDIDEADRRRARRIITAMFLFIQAAVVVGSLFTH